MSKCTAAQAVAAMEYWLGYLEKASSTYASSRLKEVFEKNAGSANYTYAGYLCGVQGQPWCAAQVTTAITEACDSRNDAKTVMYGLWPYVACNQLYDAAPASAKGRRGAWTPKPGDIIVFTDDGTVRSHTGMVYAVDATYVYTIEGNSGNMCRKRSYLLTSTYIYGYVRPAYADAEEGTTTTVELYGAAVSVTGLCTLSKGTAGPQVKTIQRILYARGIKGSDNKAITVDGDFGKNTQAAVKTLQNLLGLAADGVVGADTWTAMLTALT